MCMCVRAVLGVRNLLHELEEDLDTATVWEEINPLLRGQKNEACRRNIQMGDIIMLKMGLREVT